MTTATDPIFSSAASKPSSATLDVVSAPPYRLNVSDVAAQFSLEYYKTMSLQPESLHAFYGKQSQMVHSVEGDLEAPICSTLEAIHNRILAMNYQGARIIVESIDALPSVNGGIFLQTTGNMRLKSLSCRKFVQAFFLAEQPNGYFVLNDTFRYIETSQQPSALSQELKTKHETKSVKPARESTVLAAIPNQANPSSLTASDMAPQMQHFPPAKATAATPPSSKIEAPSHATKPGSWASLAAGHTELWKDGVVAPSKTSLVVNVPVDQSPKVAASGKREPKGRLSREPSSLKQDLSRSVFVRNLGNDADVEGLRKVLEAAGKITSLEYISSKSQAFVEFETAENAAKAIVAKYMFRGAPLTVEARRIVSGNRGHSGAKSRRDQ